MINRLFNLPRSIVVACAAVTALVGARLIAADALTQHYNNARTGAVLDETKLTTGTVNTAGFGKLWTLYADGQIVAQPLYVSDSRSIPREIRRRRSCRGRSTPSSWPRCTTLAQNYRISTTVAQFDRSAQVLQ